MEAKHKLRRFKYFKLLFILAFFLTGYSSTQGQCIANFNGGFTGCSTYQFADVSFPSPGYTIVNWDWDFGDGNTSTLQNPIHTFAPGAPYIVTLTITADSLTGSPTCTDVTTQVIIVPGLPTVYFTWDPEPTCLGNPLLSMVHQEIL